MRLTDAIVINCEKGSITENQGTDVKYMSLLCGDVSATKDALADYCMGSTGCVNTLSDIWDLYYT